MYTFILYSFVQIASNVEVSKANLQCVSFIPFKVCSELLSRLHISMSLICTCIKQCTLAKNTTSNTVPCDICSVRLMTDISLFCSWSLVAALDTMQLCSIQVVSYSVEGRMVLYHCLYQVFNQF